MKNLLRTIGMVIFLSVLAKGIGFIRDVFITRYLGFGSVTDGLLLAVSVSTLLLSITNTSIRTSFAPMFAQNYSKNKMQSLSDFKATKSFLVIIIGIIAISAGLFPEVIVNIIGPGLNVEAKKVAVVSIRIFSVLIIFNGVFSIYSSFLQSIKVFKTNEISILINNITIIIFIVIFYEKIGFYSVVFGYVFGSLFQYLFSFYRYKKKTRDEQALRFNYDLKAVTRFVNYAKFIVIGSIFTQLMVLSDKIVASFLVSGSITALHYGNVIKTLPLTLVVLVVTNMFFTEMSINHKDKERMQDIICNQLYILTFFISIALSVLILFREDIITLLFYRGNFTLDGVKMTASTLLGYLLGLNFWVIKDVLNKVSYSSQNSKIPTLTAFLSLVFNTTLNIILGHYFGPFGIALATSINLILLSIITMSLLNKTNVFVITKRVKSALCFSFIYPYIVLIISYLIYFSANALISGKILSTLITLIVLIMIQIIAYVKMLKPKLKF